MSGNAQMRFFQSTTDILAKGQMIGRSEIYDKLDSPGRPVARGGNPGRKPQRTIAPLMSRRPGRNPGAVRGIHL